MRFIPINNGRYFHIEFVYKKAFQKIALNHDKVLSIDFGLDNFASCFDSTSGASFIIDGRYIKAKNQWYNKLNAKLQSIKDLQHYQHQTRRMQRLNDKRHNVINDYFNRAVKYITDYCLANDIGSIVYGDFKAIKQDIHHGKRNNQNFMQIPYGRFKQKLAAKCQQIGIEVHGIEESYTSKTSFLDNELVQKQDSYVGKRIKRGLFRSKNGILVNADTNGSANILRKFASKQNLMLNLEQLYRGFVNKPVRVKFDTLC